MKKIKVEIPVTILTAVTVALLLYSGNLVYQSFSEIINSLQKEARPDYKMILVKDIASDLTEIENNVKLYSLSEKRGYLSNYYKLRKSVDAQLLDLQDYAFSGSDIKVAIDSLDMLSRQKMVIWQAVLNLHLSKEDEHDPFTDYYEKLDTIPVEKDTIHFEEGEKVGFFKRLLKKPEPPKPVIVDRTPQKEKMRQEIAAIEKEIQEKNLAIAAKETSLMQRSLQITNALAGIISNLEKNEREKLMQKTQEADFLASLTYKRLVMFAGAAVLLILLVLILFFRDLRKSRRYQKVLKEAKVEAEKLARTKELFVATVSHEMRTPVNAIYGLSEQLLQKDHDARTQKDLDVIHKSTKHLIDLVNDTFDFTRIENQRLQLEPENFSLEDLLEKVEVLNKANATKRGIDFIVETENTNGVVLYGDQGRLKQVLINLVTNAIKFTDQGSVTLRVKSRDEGQKENLLIKVIDTGIGIPKESQELIFNDFVQLETDANKKARGTGLGLYIVKKLVELLGGTIRLESRVNVGTTFYLNIPFEKGNPAKIQTVTKSLTSPDVLRGVDVLIVDDEEFNRYLLKNILGKWKVSFQEAEDGQQALDLAAKNNFGLILMDIRMPVLNGMETARKLKADNYPAKIIALTANSQLKDFEKYKEAGFDSHLDKPFAEAKLHAVISETMEGSPVPKTFRSSAKNFTVDLKALETMSNGDSSFLKEMIEIFLKSSENSLHSLDENLERQNWQAIADIAHKLAAPVKHMNVNEVHETIKDLQAMAESNPDPDKIRSKIAQLKIEIEALNNQLKKILAENSPK